MDHKNNPIEILKSLKYLSFDDSQVTRKYIYLIIPILSILALLYMSFNIALSYVDLEIWRHDALIYTENSDWYLSFLNENGRWINYYFYDFVTSIPISICAIINMICLSLFGYLVADKFQEDKFLSIIFGLCLLLSPLLHLQNLWPQTSMMAFVLLPVVFGLSKILPPYLLYFISAILFFGTLSNFYFLVPLIYLKDIIISEDESFIKRLISFTKNTVFPFVVSFVIAYLITNGIIIQITGNPIILGEWRNPKPINDFNQFVTNFNDVHIKIGSFLTKLFSEVHIIVWGLLGGLIALIVNRKMLWMTIVLVVIFLSPFYTTIYHGIMVSERTLMTSMVAVITLFVLIPTIKFKSNIVHIALCLLFIFPLYQRSISQLKLFNKTTGYYLHHLKNATKEIIPSNATQIVLFINRNEVVNISQSIKRHYGTNFKWGEDLGAIDRLIIPPLKSLGYKKVFVAIDKETIKSVKKEVSNQSTTSEFVVFPLRDQSYSFGMTMNHSELNTKILEKL